MAETPGCILPRAGDAVHDGPLRLLGQRSQKQAHTGKNLPENHGVPIGRCSVGLTEAEARDARRRVGTAVKQVPATFRGWLHAVGNAGVIKLVVDRDERVLVGATVVGPNAGDVLGMLGLAVHAEVPLDVLQSMTYAFPTFYGGIGEAIGAYGRGVTTVLDPGYADLAALDEVG